MEGFGQEIRAFARREAPAKEFRTVTAGVNNLQVRRLGAQPFSEFPAVHAFGHHHVGEQQCGLAPGGLPQRQRFLAVGADPLPPYSELAARLAVTESTIRSHVTRLRARYREMLRAEVRRTVDTESEVDEELRELLRVLIEN